MSHFSGILITTPYVSSQSGVVLNGFCSESVWFWMRLVLNVFSSESVWFWIGLVLNRFGSESVLLWISLVLNQFRSESSWFWNGSVLNRRSSESVYTTRWTHNSPKMSTKPQNLQKSRPNNTMKIGTQKLWKYIGLSSTFEPEWTGTHVLDARHTFRSHFYTEKNSGKSKTSNNLIVILRAVNFLKKTS